MPSRVTINDVAAESGVSRATVSLVLRGSAKIPDSTAQRVRAAMARIGYVYNRQAANLRTQRTMTIGLVLTGVRDPWFADLTMAVEDSAHDAGCTLLTGYSRDQLDRQDALLSTMVEHRVDGIVALPTSETTAGDLALNLGVSNVPHVLIDRRVAGYESDRVRVDHWSAGEQVAGHLADIGVRSMAFLGGPPSCPVRAEREGGLRSGASARGIEMPPDLSIATDAERLGGTLAANRLLENRGLPDAIVAYSDVVALGVVGALRHRGIEAGRGIAVAGFDDIEEAAVQPTPLTTTSTFPTRLGWEAVRLLLERIADPAVPQRDIVIDPVLHVRESTTRWVGGHAASAPAHSA
jgi:LacI family transcriptional regulator